MKKRSPQARPHAHGMPRFSLQDYELQRDPDESDEQYAVRRALFEPAVTNRAEEKRRERQADLGRLSRGEIS